MAAPSANAAAPVPVTRIAGANRFGTAAAIAEAAFPAGANTAIVATGFNFPDALAGNYLAGVDKAPILLVNVDNVPSETSAALQTLHTKNVIILGQTNAVDQNTQNQLTSAGYNVSRIGGATRLETMQMIDEAPNATTIGTAPNGKKTALLARADNFPDALGGGPVAYAKNFPVILTATDSLSPQAQDVITKDGIQQVIILGGNLAVSSATESQANAAGAATLFRANGVDRSDTSRLLAEYSIANLGFTTASYGIASGDQGFTGADALASGPFSGGIPQPTLVTNSINDPGTLVQFGAAHNGTATKCYAFGGPIPLPDSTVNAICNATPGAAQQAYTVTPNTASTQQTGSTRNYSVSGLNGSFSLTTFQCAKVTNGTFTGSNPGGTGNVAMGSPTNATFTSVFGLPTGNQTQLNGIPNSGNSPTATFTITDATAECVVPVVFQDLNGNGKLDLNAAGQPTEPFGIGGSTTFQAAPATAGPINGTAVTGTNPSGNQFTAGGSTYTYGNSGDVYQLVVGGSCVGDSQADFNQRLTAGDTVTGQYNPGGPSTFCLNDIAPAPPTSVTSTLSTTSQGIKVTFNDSTSSSVVSYNVYRAPANAPVPPGGFTCPTLGNAPGVSPQTPPTSPYTLLANVADTSLSAGSGAETYSYTDNTVASTSPATNYCYAVSSVDQNGQIGTATGSGVTAGPTPTSAPTFVSASASTASHTITVTYSAPILCSSVDTNGSDFTVTQSNGAVPPVNTAITPTSAACAAPTVNGSGQVVDTNVVITVPAGSLISGQTVTIAAKTGADGNTVSNTSGQFQAVGNAVQETNP